jgi:hypothetical protein
VDAAGIVDVVDVGLRAAVQLDPETSGRPGERGRHADHEIVGPSLIRKKTQKEKSNEAQPQIPAQWHP